MNTSFYKKLLLVVWAFRVKLRLVGGAGLVLGVVYSFGVWMVHAAADDVRLVYDLTRTD